MEDVTFTPDPGPEWIRESDAIGGCRENRRSGLGNPPGLAGVLSLEPGGLNVERVRWLFRGDICPVLECRRIR